jgi:hypothetical protein
MSYLAGNFHRDLGDGHYEKIPPMLNAHQEAVYKPCVDLVAGFQRGVLYPFLEYRAAVEKARWHVLHV